MILYCQKSVKLCDLIRFVNVISCKDKITLNSDSDGEEARLRVLAHRLNITEDNGCRYCSDVNSIFSVTHQFS